MSLKTPVSSCSEPQTSSGIELSTTFVPSVTDKNKIILFCILKNIIQNDVTITNNDDIKLCDTAKKIIEFQPFQHLIIIQNLLLPHPQVY